MMQVKSVQLTYIWIHYTLWCTLQGQGTYLVLQLTSHSIIPVSLILLFARVTGATCSFICVVKPNILKVKIDIMGNFWHEDLCMSARNVSLLHQRAFSVSSFSSVGYDAICIKFESVLHTMLRFCYTNTDNKINANNGKRLVSPRNCSNKTTEAKGNYEIGMRD